MSLPPAIVSLGRRSNDLALHIQAALPGSAIHAPEGVEGPADRRFGHAAAHLRAMFVQGQPIVGVCAAGILIRALAPVLHAKASEPPVLAVALDGSAVVPLLGGHHGGVALARRIADALGGVAAITTASDAVLGTALDEPPRGWVLDEAESAKAATGRLLDGGGVSVLADPGLDASWLGLPAGDVVEVVLSDRSGVSGDLVYRPRRLVLGVGCERGAAPEAMIALAETLLAEAGLSARAVACVASIDLKAAEPAVHALAAHLEVPARFLAADRLRAETARLLSPSAAAHAATGTWGVAEGAALAAVGADGALVVGKRVAGRCTVALARAPAPVDPADVGQARGRLAIVGLGPGGPAWRTAEAERLLAEASDLVGYSLYLDLAGPLPGQVRHDYPIGSEEERCVAALDLAATGRSVALLGSGDAGIYGLATLVFELLGRSPERVGWQRVEIVVSPGVSALQLAAARVGAPLNHDFCAISLSDLLTPWAAIERRLVAAAEGDFVVALYNPVSSRRREALPQARAILLRNRPPETPVVIARNLGRAGETVVPITLAELEPASVDMLSLVLVGSTATRRTPRLHGPDWIYTPRGYRLG